MNDDAFFDLLDNVKDRLNEESYRAKYGPYTNQLDNLEQIFNDALESVKALKEEA